MPMTRTAAPLLLVAAMSAGGCDIIGPSCLARQKTGPVTSLSGQLEAGRIDSHLVRYELSGSQNDVRVTWNGQGTIDGPRLRIYATDASCTEFTAPPVDDPRVDRGECTVTHVAGGYLAPDARPCAKDNTCQPMPHEIINTSLIVTGPGNGAPAGFSEYKLHVVSDATRPATYSISVTWFSGPDC
jgi:hypothetical protein